MFKKIVLFIVIASCANTGSASETGADQRLRDPTRPLGYSTAAAEKTAVKLQAIFNGNGRKEAVINGKTLAEGQSIGGVKVMRIEENKVTYLADGQSHTVWLRPNVIKVSK